VGTIAMFFVGGGILMHGSHTVSDGVAQLAQRMGLLETLFPSLVGAVIGLAAGYIMVKIMDRFFSNSSVETV